MQQQILLGEREVVLEQVLSIKSAVRAAKLSNTSVTKHQLWGSSGKQMERDFVGAEGEAGARRAAPEQ
jgi:hypothetical protein